MEVIGGGQGGEVEADADEASRWRHRSQKGGCLSQMSAISIDRLLAAALT